MRPAISEPVSGLASAEPLRGPEDALYQAFYREPLVEQLREPMT